MDFNYYQELARSTAIYPDIGNNIQYPTLCLCGETGEVAEKVKKIIRDKNGKWDSKDKMEIAKELGDCLWYISNLASEFKLNLDDVAIVNINKLKNRQKRGVLQGSGDNR